MAEKPVIGSHDRPAEEKEKDYYFESYGSFGIHHEMLSDEVRTNAYRNAILLNKHAFVGKTVLDVGCGTGILSLFAAKAGAKRVIGVDYSNIIHVAKKVVKDNRYDHVITLIEGKIEEIELPDGIEKVDIIISEWMGYCLFYESMLNSVLFARDKWLVEGGLMLPDRANVYLGAIEDAQYKGEHIGFWDDVYGFDMSAIGELVALEPLVEFADPRQVCTTYANVKQLDLYTCKVEDLEFEAPFRLRAKRNDVVHGFIIHFDVEFSRLHKTVTLTTAAEKKHTHWKQTIVYINGDFPIQFDEVIEGTIGMGPNRDNPRNLNLTLDISFDGQLDKHFRKYKFVMK